MTESSILTLDYIVEKDNVTDRFRRNFLIKKALKASLFGMGGISAVTVSAFKMITDWEFSWLLTGAVITGAAAAVFGYEEFDKAEKTLGELKKEAGKVFEIPEYSYIGGKISRYETAIERNYGTPVDFINSLDELKYDKNDKERSLSLKLVDKILVKSIKFENYKADDGYTVDENGGQTTKYIYIEGCKFTLEREDEKIDCFFRAENSLPAIYSKLKKYGKERIAVLARELENGQLLVEKIYHPHPLLFKSQSSDCEPIYRI